MAGILKAGNKDVTTAGTAVPLASTKTKCNWILMHPKTANTGHIYLGDSGVTATNGVVMDVGDSDVVWPMMTFAEYDLNQIYIDASVSGEGVQFIYVVI